MQNLRQQDQCGNGEHAGIPVVQYNLCVPSLEGDDRSARRINTYYTRMAEAGVQYAQGEMTRLAAENFRQCMERSRPFQTFLLDLRFTGEFAEDQMLLTIRLVLTAYLGNEGEWIQTYTDIWDLHDGLPAGKAGKTAGRT